ncbi:hypothetical protein PODOV045v1_p0008 [Vibrio phage 69E27.1]|nr:hypothetical protein PODOV045v1_p0008 [Vibrio phage 69E27.1]
MSAAQQLIKEIEFRNRLRGIIEARGCGLNALAHNGQKRRYRILPYHWHDSQQRVR